MNLSTYPHIPDGLNSLEDYEGTKKMSISIYLHTAILYGPQIIYGGGFRDQRSIEGLSGFSDCKAPLTVFHFSHTNHFEQQKRFSYSLGYIRVQKQDSSDLGKLRPYRRPRVCIECLNKYDVGKTLPPFISILDFFIW